MDEESLSIVDIYIDNLFASYLMIWGYGLRS